MNRTRLISVKASRCYDIHIGEGLLDRVGEYISHLTLGKKIMIVSDDTVAALYLDRLKAALDNLGYECHSYVFPHGEESKCADTYLGILSALASAHFDRSDSIFALGGGVVGDISGFSAATYMRGIRYVQIPSTLLSAVDSSVGGKCAIDIKEGKNLVGAFWQPSAVICDVKLLDTLPKEYFSDGMAEVIKYAMIRSRSLADILAGGKAKERIIDVIEECVRIKRDIVAVDERDTGLRAILNFGHTAAHAIEAESNFSISHGRAVGMGMLMICKGARKMGLCSEDTVATLRSMMEDYSLTLECPYPTEILLPYIKNDKKCKGDSVELVLPRSVGECELRKVAFEKIHDYIG